MGLEGKGYARFCGKEGGMNGVCGNGEIRNGWPFRDEVSWETWDSALSE